MPSSVTLTRRSSAGSGFSRLSRAPQAVGRPTTADGKPTTADGKPTTADGKPTTADGKQLPSARSRSPLRSAGGNVNTAARRPPPLPPPPLLPSCLTEVDEALLEFSVPLRLLSLEVVTLLLHNARQRVIDLQAVLRVSHRPPANSMGAVPSSNPKAAVQRELRDAAKLAEALHGLYGLMHRWPALLLRRLLARHGVSELTDLNVGATVVRLSQPEEEATLATATRAVRSVQQKVVLAWRGAVRERAEHHATVATRLEVARRASEARRALRGWAESCAEAAGGEERGDAAAAHWAAAQLHAALVAWGDGAARGARAACARALSTRRRRAAALRWWRRAAAVVADGDACERAAEAAAGRSWLRLWRGAAAARRLLRRKASLVSLCRLIGWLLHWRAQAAAARRWRGQPRGGGGSGSGGGVAACRTRPEHLTAVRRGWLSWRATMAAATVANAAVATAATSAVVTAATTATTTATTTTARRSGGGGRGDGGGGGAALALTAAAGEATARLRRRQLSGARLRAGVQGGGAAVRRWPLRAAVARWAAGARREAAVGARRRRALALLSRRSAVALRRSVGAWRGAAAAAAALGGVGRGWLAAAAAFGAWRRRSGAAAERRRRAGAAGARRRRRLLGGACDAWRRRVASLEAAHALARALASRGERAAAAAALTAWAAATARRAARGGVAAIVAERRRRRRRRSAVARWRGEAAVEAAVAACEARAAEASEARAARGAWGAWQTLLGEADAAACGVGQDHWRAAALRAGLTAVAFNAGAAAVRRCGWLAVRRAALHCLSSRCAAAAALERGIAFLTESGCAARARRVARGLRRCVRTQRRGLLAWARAAVRWGRARQLLRRSVAFWSQLHLIDAWPRCRAGAEMQRGAGRRAAIVAAARRRRGWRDLVAGATAAEGRSRVAWTAWLAHLRRRGAATAVALRHWRRAAGVVRRAAEAWRRAGHRLYDEMRRSFWAMRRHGEAARRGARLQRHAASFSRLVALGLWCGRWRRAAARSDRAHSSLLLVSLWRRRRLQAVLLRAWRQTICVEPIVVARAHHFVRLALPPLRAWRAVAARARLVRSVRNTVGVRRVIVAHRRGRAAVCRRVVAAWRALVRRCGTAADARLAAVLTAAAPPPGFVHPPPRHGAAPDAPWPPLVAAAPRRTGKLVRFGPQPALDMSHRRGPPTVAFTPAQRAAGCYLAVHQMPRRGHKAGPGAVTNASHGVAGSMSWPS